MFSQVMKIFLKNSQVVLPLCLIITIVAPFSFYLGNYKLINLNWYEVLFGLGVFFSASILGLTALVSLFRGFKRAHAILCAIFSVLAVLLWFQLNIFVWDFGPLDGRGIDWGKWQATQQYELFFWFIALFLALVWGCFRDSVYFLKINRYLTFVVLLSFSVTFFSSGFGFIKSEQRGDLDAVSFFNFHEKNNVFLIVLDTFQNDIFSEIVETYPDEVSFLKGFTFFPDAMGGYPTTQASIPLMLTGEFYKNKQPVYEFFHQNNERYNVVSDLANKNYGVKVSYLSLLNPSIFSGLDVPKVSMGDFNFSSFGGFFNTFLTLVDGGLFRSSPTYFKESIYQEGNWFLTRSLTPGLDAPGAHGQDLSFISSYEKHFQVQSNNSGEFRLIHFAAAHWPLQMDENYSYVGLVKENRPSYIDQSRGALKLVERFVNKLIVHGLYDDALIIVVADHGSHSISMRPNDLINEDAFGSSSISLDVLAAARPLFLVKPSGASGDLSLSNYSVHLGDIPELLTYCLEWSDCFSFLDRPSFKREYYHYNWTSEFWSWSQQFMPPMRKFVVNGDVRDLTNWADTGLIYSNGGVVKVGNASYQLGEVIRFDVGGASDQYIGRGWSHAEASHRWTDGPISYLSLRNDEFEAGQALKLTLNVFPYGNLENTLSVYLNGIEVGEVIASSHGIHSIVFTPDLIDDGNFEFSFRVKNTYSPCDTQSSRDCRHIGFGFVSMELSYAN